LNALKRFLIDDCLVLAWIQIRLVFDLATVDGIGQQRVDTAFIELTTALGNPLL
jgi:hypothetical protein